MFVQQHTNPEKKEKRVIMCQILCRVLFLALIFLSCPHSVWAEQDTTILSLSVARDNTSELTINDIVEPGFDHQFKPLKGHILNAGLTHSTYWVKVVVSPDIHQRENMVMELGYPLIDKFTLYIPSSADSFIIKKTGLSIPVSAREYKGNSYLFYLSESDSNVFYLQVKSHFLFRFMLDIKSFDASITHQHVQNLFWGVILGALFVTFLYNLFMLIASRDSSYFHYCLFIFFSALNIAVYRGFTVFFLSDTLYTLSYQHLFPLIGITLLSGSFFIRTQFRSINYVPIIKLFFSLSFAFSWALILVSFILEGYFNTLISLILMFLAVFFIAIPVVKLPKVSPRSGTLLIMAYFPMVLGVMITSLTFWEVIPSQWATIDAMYIGLFLGIMIFSIGMTDQVNELKRDLEISYIRLKMKNQELLSEMEDRSHAKSSLKDSEKRYRQIFENSQTAYFELSSKNELMSCNPAFEKITQHNQWELFGKSIEWMFLPSGHFESLLSKLQVNYSLSDVEIKTQTKFGTNRNLLLFLKAIPEEDKIIGSFLDITVRKKMEMELSLLRNQLKNIFDAIPSVIISVDDRLRVLNWNKPAEKYISREVETLKGGYFSDVFPKYGRYLERIYTAVETGDQIRFPKIEFQEGNELRMESVAISPLNTDDVFGAVIKIDDITDQTRMENMVIQSEKMLSVGGLAAGMAHELNNPLGAIAQSTQNIERRLSAELKANHPVADALGLDLKILEQYLAERKIDSFLSNVKEAAMRASRIIQQMLQFSRRNESQMAPTDIIELIENVVELAGKHYDMRKKLDFRNIKLIREFEPNLPIIPVNPTEIEQVILNLLINASWALNSDNHKGDSKITLRVHREKTMIRIEVEDNGPGISDLDRKRVFEPFYTTKPIGEGTGLGLSVSFMIITNNHDGTIEAESQPGKGTRFIIRLPIEKADPSI